MNETLLTDLLERCLKKCLETAQTAQLDVLSDYLAQTITTIQQPMQLAIIGKISSSKSTLVNALLGKEVVGMGQMEETFNVSWLKYGSSEADIKVVFKDGHTEWIKREEWNRWAGQERNLLKTKVQYLEVTYDHEILKRINIIDTPGLDSLHGIDSQNTIDFLKLVRPDAVLMVFTKAVAESTMEVLQAFQQTHGMRNYHLSPLNAIGLYAKIDFMWSPTEAIMPADKANSVIQNNIYKKFPQLKESLHAILPICAMLGLAAFTIDENDYDQLQELSKIPLAVLQELCSDPDDFVEENISHYTALTAEERKRLYIKFGLFGCYQSAFLIKQSHIGLQDLRTEFMQISGFGKVRSRILTLFGERAVLIKTQNVAQNILQQCKQIRLEYKNAEKHLDVIEEILLETVRNMNEYDELDFLSKIYDGSLQGLPIDAVEEYKHLCGEYGYSVLKRLSMPYGSSCQAMVDKAKQRAKEVNRKKNNFQKSYPQYAKLYHMMERSYNVLIERIWEMEERKEKAEKELIIVKSFFDGE